MERTHLTERQERGTLDFYFRLELANSHRRRRTLSSQDFGRPFDAEQHLQRIDPLVEVASFVRNFALPRARRLIRKARVDLLLQATPFRRYPGLCGFQIRQFFSQGVEGPIVQHRSDIGGYIRHKEDASWCETTVPAAARIRSDSPSPQPAAQFP
jgi:hypothetical protein